MNLLTPAILLMAALASLLLALAAWMLERARRRERQQSVSSHLRRSLGQRPVGPLLPAAVSARPGPAQAAAFAGPVMVWLERVPGLRAWGIAPGMLAALAAAGLLLAAIAASRAGWAAAALALALYGLLAAFGIWRRMGKRRARLLHQLPGFLDNMVRLISIGNSPHAAFQLAVGNVAAPLGYALQQANAMLGANPDLGQAMAQLERHWRLPEFGLLAAVFRMSVRYGGRADLVLERVATYIRDRISAERELHALSAEIRLSAWVLALLPIVVGALIMALNQGYFMRMWNDPGGQKMILLAAALEAFGAFLLYRLARLK